MSSKLFRIQSSFVIVTSSTHSERFFIQKKFLWWWVDLSTESLGPINRFNSLLMAEEFLNFYIKELKKESILKKEIKALNKNAINLKSKYYLREDDRLISGNSVKELDKKSKMKAFL